MKPSGDLLIDGLFSGNPETSVSLSHDFVLERVNDFASAGLRTLVMGARLLSANEWTKLKIDLDGARGRVHDRETAIIEAFSAVESNLMLVGCTGVEDKLQDGVPETITALRQSGIQVCYRRRELQHVWLNLF